MVTGRQNSITTEPYQSLALDVGAPNVRNVVDAIRQLTYGEKLEGDGFDTDRGRNVSVTKQTLIDTLPPVLILHLKRFQFDATGGISKIWKKIGYPLELEIPASALSKQWRAKQIPRYKLMAVVYHHGRQATGGHYTVDVRRQDDVEWVRLDDTSIRRVSSDDVVEKEEAATKGGVPQAQQQSSSRDASVNRFGAINDEDGAEQGEWTAVDKANGTKNAWKGRRCQRQDDPAQGERAGQQGRLPALLPARVGGHRHGLEDMTHGEAPLQGPWPSFCSFFITTSCGGRSTRGTLEGRGREERGGRGEGKAALGRRTWLTMHMKDFRPSGALGTGRVLPDRRPEARGAGRLGRMGFCNNKSIPLTAH